MNWDANTIHWGKGDFVLHDADAKEPKMLMVVTGYDDDGLVRTRYVYPREGRNMREGYRNDLKYLHDPKEWGVDENTKQSDVDAIRIWNSRYKVGTKVTVKLDFVDEPFETVTRTKAQAIKCQGAWIWLEGVVGAYLLSFVTAIEPPNTSMYTKLIEIAESLPSEF